MLLSWNSWRRRNEKINKKLQPFVPKFISKRDEQVEWTDRFFISFSFILYTCLSCMSCVCLCLSCPFPIFQSICLYVSLSVCLFVCSLSVLLTAYLFLSLIICFFSLSFLLSFFFSLTHTDSRPISDHINGVNGLFVRHSGLLIPDTQTSHAALPF